jgi:hypothetical protein
MKRKKRKKHQEATDATRARHDDTKPGFCYASLVESLEPNLEDNEAPDDIMGGYPSAAIIGSI